MVWLNASLAFALAMIIFCTMVTAVTEAMHQFFNMRQRGLERMLGQLFEKVICPRLDLTANIPKLEKDFLETLTGNPAVPQHDGWLSGLRSWFVPRTLDHITLAQFVDRFADTVVGKQLWSSGPEHAIAVVNDVGHRFERFEAGASSYFAQRAQTVALVVAVLLAFALNIDALRLFSAFLTDQQLTAGVLARADQITADYDASVASKAPELPTTGERPPRTGTTQSVPAGNAERAGGGSGSPDPGNGSPTDGASAEADDAAAQALEEQAAILKQKIAASTALGLPIGGAYYPWCLDDAQHATCQEPLTWSAICAAIGRPSSVSMPALRRFLRWVGCVLLAGVLIGLGGPFWFDAFSNLSAFVRLLGGPSKTSDAAPPNAAAPQPPVEPRQPKTPGEAFATAAQRSTPKLPRGRMLLTAIGTPK